MTNDTVTVVIELTKPEARAICGGAQFGLPRDLDSAVLKIREALKNACR